ncbi:MAG: hypothetical protein ACHRHE_00355 [Tepidisphaerales bacterium]
MSVLLKHENRVFEDQTVYATGNAYHACVFRRCVFVAASPGNMVFDECVFDACAWHLNFVVHDLETCEAAQKLLRYARQSVPTVQNGMAAHSPN